MPLPSMKEQFAALIAAPSVSCTQPHWDQSNRAVIELLSSWLGDLGFACETQEVSPGKVNLLASYIPILGSLVSGAVAIVGHISLTDKVHITARSLVSASISEAGSYSSGTPLAQTKDWRKNAARFRQLDSLATRLIKLERK